MQSNDALCVLHSVKRDATQKHWRVQPRAHYRLHVCILRKTHKLYSFTHFLWKHACDHIRALTVMDFLTDITITVDPHGYNHESVGTVADSSYTTGCNVSGAYWMQ